MNTPLVYKQLLILKINTLPCQVFFGKIQKILTFMKRKATNLQTHLTQDKNPPVSYTDSLSTHLRLAGQGPVSTGLVNITHVFQHVVEQIWAARRW